MKDDYAKIINIKILRCIFGMNRFFHVYQTKATKQKKRADFICKGDKMLYWFNGIKSFTFHFLMTSSRLPLRALLLSIGVCTILTQYFTHFFRILNFK